ncbi:hypothetical protein CEXT_588201 [Caerostris extrusa]|uniref:Uncharacterized protein n=1 Tax=Caerostris extrusa TaxID=172846 RepID=A0AAV4WKY7_CAEEX|nr:hypothetical protein CEXT_588201 [Caerostris extrusa]
MEERKCTKKNTESLEVFSLPKSSGAIWGLSASSVNWKRRIGQEEEYDTIERAAKCICCGAFFSRRKLCSEMFALLRRYVRSAETRRLNSLGEELTFCLKIRYLQPPKKEKNIASSRQPEKKNWQEEEYDTIERAAK